MISDLEMEFAESSIEYITWLREQKDKTAKSYFKYLFLMEKERRVYFDYLSRIEAEIVRLKEKTGEDTLKLFPFFQTNVFPNQYGFFVSVRRRLYPLNKYKSQTKINFLQKMRKYVYTRRLRTTFNTKRICKV